jgi:formylmethanofuran dehydrogenase subunit C
MVNKKSLIGIVLFLAVVVIIFFARFNPIMSNFSAAANTNNIAVVETVKATKIIPETQECDCQCSDTDRYTDKDIDKITMWAYKNAKKYVPIHDVREIVEEASKYDSFLLLIAVMCEESRFDRYARSSKNAMGLCQIIGSVWLETLQKQGIAEKKIDLFDYRVNIKAADYILNHYFEKKKSWKGALSAYVNGSKTYVLNVLSNYAELQFLLKGV